MYQRVFHFLNPFNTASGAMRRDYAWASALLAALLIFAGGLGAGAVIEKHHLSEQYFVRRYADLGLAVPHTLQAGPPIEAPIPRNLPSTPSLNPAWVEAPLDQGQQGACAGASDSEAITYYVRQHFPHHPGIHFSWEWPYSYFVDTYSDGQDAGSDPVRDAEYVASKGTPQFKLAPGTGIINPLPTSPSNPAVANAAQWKLPLRVETLYYGAPSDAVYQEAVAALSQGRVAILGIEVTPSFDAAWNTGRVWYAGTAESDRGAHAIIAWRVPGVTMPDGSPALELRNSWTNRWGTGGDVLVSELWIAHNAFSVWALTGA